SNAALQAQLGTGEENKSWVDTNAGTDFPDNDIVFNAGRAVANVVVTKFGTGVRLHFVTPNRDAFSTNFNVDVGAPNRIHFTIRGKASSPTQGETWTPGTYPGNSGTPPVVNAGEDIVLEARITDRRWNLISGGGASTNRQFQSGVPNNFIYFNSSNSKVP